MIGVIGGSLLTGDRGRALLSNVRIAEVAAPFGSPSSEILVGEFEGTPIGLLNRHGPGHRYPPHLINYRANLAGLKSAGVDQVVGLSAVGSLTEEVAPGDFVVVDQFIDLTRGRVTTVSDAGSVLHAPFGDPTCPRLGEIAGKALSQLSYRHHSQGTYLCIEGPHYSTRAESMLYRSWGATVVGMTAATEAKVARELALCFACVAVTTDYDCWKPNVSPVNAEAVAAEGARHEARLIEVIRGVIRESRARTCACRHMMDHARPVVRP